MAGNGGPPVTVPERKGFGSLLIEQSFSGEGENCVDFRPDGVRCSLELAVSSPPWRRTGIARRRKGNVPQFA